MSSYAELKAQIAELEKKANEARNEEIASAKAQIAEIMATYELSIDDLRGITKFKAEKLRKTVPPKYRNPADGETWTGRGRAPKWIEGKNKEEFLIP